MLEPAALKRGQAALGLQEGPPLLEESGLLCLKLLCKQRATYILEV